MPRSAILLSSDQIGAIPEPPPMQTMSLFDFSRSMKGPYGVFMLREKSNSDIVCIGGGSGMAPIWSLLNSMAERGIERRATYFYGARTRKDLFYLDRLQQLEERLPGFRFVPALSMATAEDEWDGETGLITEVLDRNLEAGQTQMQAY